MTADRHAARRAVALLAAVVLSLVAALTLSASPAVADGGSLVGTGVAASNPVQPDGVGPIVDVSAGQGRGTAAGSYDNALGCCVATQSTGPRWGGRMQGDTGAIDPAGFKPGGGQAGNRLRPDRTATGPHSTFRQHGTTGETTHYATWRPQTNPPNPAPWEMVHRVDVIGQPHFNKVLGEYVPTPHVQGPGIPGGVRPAEPWEVPRGH